MKKFWPLLLIGLLALATWTTHYVQMISAETNKPLATFETIQGDEAYLKNVALEGSFDNRWTYARLVIEDGKLFPRSQGLLQTRTAIIFEDLIKKHRSFMRGKTLNTSQFYVHNDTIAYIENMGESGATHIDVTFASEGDYNTSFTVDVPVDKPIAWTYTYDVTLQGNMAYALADVMFSDGSEALYSIELNMEDGTLVQAERLFEAVDEGEIDYFISLIGDSYSIHHEDYFVYMTGNFDPEADNSYGVRSDSEIRVWNTLTNTKSEFTLPEHLQNIVEGNRIIVKDNLLLFSMIDKDQFITERYNLDTNKWLEPIVITIDGEMTPEASFSFLSAEQYVYGALRTTEGTLITILDPQAGSVLYTGKMIAQNPSDILSIYYAIEQ